MSGLKELTRGKPHIGLDVDRLIYGDFQVNKSYQKTLTIQNNTNDRVRYTIVPPKSIAFQVRRRKTVSGNQRPLSDALISGWCRAGYGGTM
jgi:hypothetical protein